MKINGFTIEERSALNKKTGEVNTYYVVTEDSTGNWNKFLVFDMAVAFCRRGGKF